jgi:hypothetical protein
VGRSDDQMVHIFPQPTTKRIARLLLTPLLVVLLLAPVMICHAMDTSSRRLTVLTIAAVAFIAAISLLTKAKTIDLTAAGAT